MNCPSPNNIRDAITAEQFDRIVGAIAEGKYSWACVLLLRSGGYNPLHYIPYRTYNRLIKQNRSSKNIYITHKYKKILEDAIERV
ncbi:HetP family heterocyst commitment protein [Synechococcus sp. PCC 7336]|uniref:HetP family heterocyst commitment protein n=1 Tax=Synechococcus sp. PCC 7336 TaxID=195250 RepID=UPI00034B0306|nr:HetP family heterocyst commitment protein [Synechococcus sp. PCC 7336]